MVKPDHIYRTASGVEQLVVQVTQEDVFYLEAATPGGPFPFEAEPHMSNIYRFTTPTPTDLGPVDPGRLFQ